MSLARNFRMSFEEKKTQNIKKSKNYKTQMRILKKKKKTYFLSCKTFFAKFSLPFQIIAMAKKGTITETFVLESASESKSESISWEKTKFRIQIQTNSFHNIAFGRNLKQINT
jgi:hypothetical protein